MIELNPILVDINLALNNLHKWMSPEYETKDLVNKFNTAYIQQAGALWHCAHHSTLELSTPHLSSGGHSHRCIVTLRVPPWGP